jgi:hypothetical protein
MIEAALYTLLIETETITSLMKPAEVCEYFSMMARYDNRFSEMQIGQDPEGRIISAYRFGNHPSSCIFCGFPGEKEEAGGRAMVALANLLQAGACNFRNMPVTWHFVPCLKMPVQGTGSSLSHPAAAQISTNSEGTALADLAASIKPCFTAIMHDTAHCPEEMPTRIGITRSLSAESVRTVNMVFNKCQTPLASDLMHPEYGKGFFQIDRTLENSIFAKLAEYGQAVTINVGKKPGLKNSDLVFLQLAAALTIMNESLVNQPS